MRVIDNSKVTEVAIVMEGAEKVTKQVLIGNDEGSNNIIMRRFRLQAGGYTPYHTHDFEHVVKIQKGNGVAVNEAGKEIPLSCGNSVFVAPNEKHQFKNTGNEVFEFLCIIPNPNPNKNTECS